jgi:enoyl-CoA hydratase/carnithine racemase
MANEFTIYEKRGRVAYVTINRPEVLNALHAQATYELQGIWDDFAADDDLWVAILTGAGSRAFSAGNDLKATAAGTNRLPEGSPPRRGGFGGITDRFDLFKPIIAAVNGWAMGGGCEMALACDIIVASETARLGLPEVRRGLFAAAGGIQRLPRQLPTKIAMGMMLTGKEIDAQTALRYGLVNEVVPQDRLMETADRWAREILECAPLAVRGTKEGATRGQDIPLEDAINRNYHWLQLHNMSPDRIEGPRAFAEKRQPKWAGI